MTSTSRATSQAQTTSTSDRWQLYYHGGIPGRGEFARLMFEEAGVAYDDLSAGIYGMFDGFSEGKSQTNTSSSPVLFPPALAKGDFLICQTPAIMRYLGKKFGMYPTNDEDVARADQVMLTALDFIAEGSDAYYPPGVEQSDHKTIQASVERWASTRFPLFLRHLENYLASNRGGTGFFVGDSLTYADIAVFHMLCAAESQLPDRFEALNIPLLKAFQGRIAQRNKIAAYLRSERRRPFSGKAFM